MNKVNRKKYRSLGYWIAVILVFIFSVQIFLSGYHERLPVIRTIMEKEIDSSALFYTDSDIAVKAERKLGKTMWIKKIKSGRPDK